MKVVSAVTLDDIDRKMLRALQADGRMTNADLARAVNLSESACLRRLRALETEHVISRYAAVVNERAVGLPISVFVTVTLSSQAESMLTAFETAVATAPEVVECYLILGDNDALMRVVVADLEDYRRFQEAHLTRKNGIRSVKTDVPSEIVKQTFALPI